MDEVMMAEIEDFLEGFNQPTYRGMWINGVRGCRPGRASEAGAVCGRLIAYFSVIGLFDFAGRVRGAFTSRKTVDEGLVKPGLGIKVCEAGKE
jgi:hypothetical protein